MKVLNAVYRSIVSASPEIRSYGVHDPESGPSVWSEDFIGPYIVHINGYPQHGSQGYQVGADMTIRYGAMISAPVTHHRIYIVEGGDSGQAWYKPGGRPARIGTFV